MTVWLASGSPRRREILTRLGFSVDVHPANIPEVRDPAEDPVAWAVRLATAKATTAPAHALVLAADTVVHLDGRVFDKPTDRDEATAHLRALSGRWHSVTTGVCIGRGHDRRALSVTTRVRFRDLDPAEIAAYVASGEADDKAGAYGIQGLGGFLVAEVRGSWTNVMGLPAEAIVEPLLACGATRWGRP